MKKTLFTLLTMMMIFTLVAGCSQEAGKSDDYILIGNLQDTSGTTAAWGKGIQWGAEYAAEKINEEGGVLGKKLKVKTYDTKNDVNESINAYNRMVQQDKVVAIVGPPTSNIGIALAPITEESKVAIFGDFMDERATTKEDGSVWNYMFLGEPSCNQQAELTADYAINKLGLKKIAILYDQSNAYAVTHAEPFAAYIESNGGQIVAKEIFQSSDKDYKAQLANITSKNPDAIYAPNYVQQNALVYQQARQMGYEGIIIGNNSYYVPFAELAGNDVEDVFFPNNVSFDDDELKPIVEEYKKQVKEEPPLHMVFGYDNVLVIADAIERAGSTDPEAIAKALKETKDVKGLTGNISINPNTHRPQGLSMYIMEVKDGKYIPIERHLIDDKE